MVAGWAVTVTQDVAKKDLQFQGVFVLAPVLQWDLLCLFQVRAACARLLWVLVFFFKVRSCKKDVRNATHSPKISSGGNFLCFLPKNGSTWSSGVGCWPVLFSRILVWCTEITLISLFLLWISLKWSPLYLCQMTSLNVCVMKETFAISLLPTIQVF